MIQVWERTKRITAILVLTILLIFGGRMEILEGKYETEERKWKDSEKKLQNGLERLKREGMDLWEANEIYQELDKIETPNSDTMRLQKISELYADILNRLGDIFKVFAAKVIENKIEEEKVRRSEI